MKYPSHIEANIHEISGSFHKEKLIVKYPYSLHTECSYGPREFNSKIISDICCIKMAQRENIPQLWHCGSWANNFFEFIERLIGSNKPPEILEIHPPFNDYCSSFNQFMDIFKVFYDKFKNKYPTTSILIENRFGTRYKGGNFLLSTCSDVLEFCEVLRKTGIDLKIVLDYPQLFSAEVYKLTAENFKINKKILGDLKESWMGFYPEQLMSKIISFNHDIHHEYKDYKKIIGGFHMWGKLKKEKRWIPHAGNFDTLFNPYHNMKNEFLKSVFSTFNDGIVRYFVPEVISGENDLHSIVNDMENAGFIFVSKKSPKGNLIKAVKKSFAFKIPETNLEYRENGFFVDSKGFKSNDGWHIEFSFGEKDGKEYMDYCADHRMTNPRHGRIYEDGTGEESVDLLDSYDPN
jgi:hypothetical protein